MKSFPFGLDKDQVTEQFTTIAEGLKLGEVIPQEVRYAEDQTQDDFVLRTVTLKFAMKKEAGNASS